MKKKKILINENNIKEEIDIVESDEDYYIIEEELNKGRYNIKNNNNKKIKIKQIPHFYEEINRYNSPMIRKINKNKNEIENNKNSLYNLNCNKNKNIYRKKNLNWNIYKKIDGNKTNPNIKKEKTKKKIKISLNIKKNNSSDKYCFTPKRNKQKYIFLEKERNLSKDNNNNSFDVKFKNKKVSTPN